MKPGAVRSLLLALLAAPAVASAAPCQAEDFETTVSGQDECLLMRRYGSAAPGNHAGLAARQRQHGRPGQFAFPRREEGRR
jgi:hypothetical protein